MNEVPPQTPTSLASKIARLVRERGWNQEDFARIANLNRHTVRQILQQRGNRRLRNATVMACARALGLSVSDLRTLPVERLLPRIHGTTTESGGDALKRLAELAKQPELAAWLEEHGDRARRFTSAEVDELLGLQGADGPLAKLGVDHFVKLIERKRQLRDRVEAIADSEYLEFLEQFVELLHKKLM